MKNIIFDFDGTLADSFEVALEVAHELTGIARLAPAEMTRLRRLPVLKILRELNIPARRLPRLVLQGRQRMSERMDEVHPFAGIPEALAALHKQGHQLLVISSNSERNVRTFLRTHTLEQYFGGVHGGVGLFDKAGALRKVLRRRKLAREACYYVGDEVRDIAAAQKAGIPIVAVGWGYQDPEALAARQPFALVQSPGDLPPLFKASTA